MNLDGEYIASFVLSLVVSIVNPVQYGNLGEMVFHILLLYWYQGK